MREKLQSSVTTQLAGEGRKGSLVMSLSYLSLFLLASSDISGKNTRPPSTAAALTETANTVHFLNDGLLHKGAK